MRRAVRRPRVGPLFHRWYSPATGRYTRPDPIGKIRRARDGLFTANHLYVYAADSPLSFVDPLGLVAWSCNVVEVSAGALFGGGVFGVECTSGCTNGTKLVADYAVGGYGFTIGATIPLELGAWDLEDGASSPDPGNLEGPFSYRGCSITPLIGFSYSEVNQGKGHGSFSFAPSGGAGIGCSVISGGSKLIHTQKSCCYEGPGPVIRAR